MGGMILWKNTLLKFPLDDKIIGHSMQISRWIWGSCVFEEQQPRESSLLIWEGSGRPRAKQALPFRAKTPDESKVQEKRRQKTRNILQLPHQPWSSLNHRGLSPPPCLLPRLQTVLHTPALPSSSLCEGTWLLLEQPHPTGVISPSPWVKAQSCHPYLHTSPTQMPLTDLITRLWITD